MEAISRRMVDVLGLKKYVDSEYSGDDVECTYQVVIDTASASQLGKYSDILRDYLLIDHHEVNTLVEAAKILLYDPRRRSSSEIVFEVMEYLLSKSSGRVPSEILTALICGILYDTKYLRLADYVTFEVMAKLIKLGGDYAAALSILSSKKELDYSERIARIKGAMRAGLYKVGDLVMVITCIGAHESSVLKLLLDAGADIAIAIATRKKRGARIIIRTTNEVIERLGFPLAAELARELGESMKGSGGGHASAAGVYVEEFKAKLFVKVLTSFFKSRGLTLKAIDEGRWLSECGD
ncbi:MAG: hypothetical protein J7L12_01995 [Desulfurococcales archaeon]|nr:hypothetical protein [Desulfurococcales archaeon]